MTDYIDLEKACSAMPDDYYGWRDKKVLESIPAADVAPVVRCKDCAEWQKDWEPRAANNGEHFCPIVGLVTAPEWYCADGNREGGWK